MTWGRDMSLPGSASAATELQRVSRKIGPPRRRGGGRTGIPSSAALGPGRARNRGGRGGDVQQLVQSLDRVLILELFLAKFHLFAGHVDPGAVGFGVEIE